MRFQELVLAKKQIDEQKKKADQKQEDQKKEAIRQAYMALLAQQNEVNLKTISIDGTPKNDDGSIPREALVRLGVLPGDQGKIADKAAKMDEDLSALGSIVYSWANRDIVKNMKEVKDQLGKQNTGVVTQAQEKQIVAQLDAMIRDLATKPEESKFAQHDDGGGGGGGGGGRGLGHAHRKRSFGLIKDLQIAENDATTTIAKQQQQAKSGFDVTPGNRQGDLRNLMETSFCRKARQRSSRSCRPNRTTAITCRKNRPRMRMPSRRRLTIRNWIRICWAPARTSLPRRISPAKPIRRRSTI